MYSTILKFVDNPQLYSVICTPSFPTLSKRAVMPVCLSSEPNTFSLPAPLLTLI
eukprot:m.267945 g.267945  ORF g.267945 m.267945 type:complete len:54 (+) comp11072_c2_seq7:2011-2172(+)